MFGEDTKAALQSVSDAASRAEKMNHPSQAHELAHAHAHLRMMLDVAGEYLHDFYRQTILVYWLALIVSVAGLVCNWVRFGLSFRNDWPFLVLVPLFIVLLSVNRKSPTIK